MTSSQEYYRDYWGKGIGSWSARQPPPSETEATLLSTYVKEGAHVLDVGCGDGKIARALRDLKVTYQGIDISTDAIELCRQQGFTAQLHNLDEPLPFADQSYDVITIFEVMEHLFLPHEVLHELARVLKPGGLIIGSVPNATQIANRVFFLAGIFNPGGSPATSLKTPWNDPHIRFFTYRSMRKMIEADPALSIVRMPGAPFLLVDQPVLYKSTGLLRRCLQCMQFPLKPLGRLWPSLFSHRVYVVAQKITLEE